MSPPASETAEAPHPRMTNGLAGHALAEAALLAAYRSGRIPHAFLFVGAKGIGKATLAYRLARFVLAHPDPTTAEVRAATSLAVDPSHPVARRIAARTHADLLVLERTPNDKGVMRQQIAVEDVYRTVSFFGSTAGEGGWRIAIVDSVDELNRFGANALLKVLEEPPRRALLLLISHSLAAVPPTLRSRCRIVTLRPLAPAEVGAALAAAMEFFGGRCGSRGGHCRRRRQRRARTGVPRRGCAGAAPAGARGARGAAGARCQRAACARRRNRRDRSAAARRLHRHHQCLAGAAPRSQRGRDRPAGALGRGVGAHQCGRP